MANPNLLEIHDRLLAFFGPQSWWPGETPFEVMVGAVLTQNTAWTNVEKGISNLKEHGLLSFEAMVDLPLATLAELIRPCGYFNIKAQRLHNLFALIRDRFDGDLERFAQTELPELRHALLEVKGIGQETADSILLYAANKPIFVVDAYTHRILSRHGLVAEEGVLYDEMQELFMAALPPGVALFNEYHALIVRAGKEFCKKSNPRCQECPLGEIRPT